MNNHTIKWHLAIAMIGTLALGAQADQKKCPQPNPDGSSRAIATDCGKDTPPGTPPRAAGGNQFTTKTEPPRPQPALLLPAVQAAHDSGSTSPSGLRAAGNGKPGQTADTSCDGVDACNDMIATCLSLGGNVSATQYDPDSGAPSGATCYSPGS